MKKRKAEEVLEIMISQLLRYLEELCECKNETGQQFEYGERTAYTECLEWIQQWEDAESNGLNFEIEKVYPL